ncbi:MAG: ATP-dependent metallopeptidase FtsH/Yme1/Tma family protein [Wenzhouxiangellaceae bacterium]
MSQFAKNLLMWIVVAMVLMSIFQHYAETEPAAKEMQYSEFLSAVRNGQIESVHIQATSGGKWLRGKTTNGQDYEVFAPPDDTGLYADLIDNKVEMASEPPERRSILVDIMISLLPVLLLVFLFIYFMRQMQGGMGGRGGAMSFGKSRAKLQGEDQVKITFADVAGVEEAKDEVSELVEFLKSPGKFQRLGGKIPKGVLMVGPPGTGKTLLARAIAGEAQVPFFSISGSDFVEMFVGVGASRVRDMFETAKKHAPCIIFIDELDAAGRVRKMFEAARKQAPAIIFIDELDSIGRTRGTGLGGGHDEREQTLNQLLVEMDGFDGHEGIIMIAATNRPDVLDPALLRPGRFDRQVVVPLPDLKGREQILTVHMKKVPIDESVNARNIARGSPGFSGADLANLVNEAALFAAREDSQAVGQEHFEKAKDKIMMGAERKSMVMSEDDKRLTAYHEAGHAIVGRIVPEHDPVYKVTIIPRGRALGVTMFLPEEDRYSQNKTQLESQLASLFGGRVAEELIYGKGKVTTGASNDIERATAIARSMVSKWGLSDVLGPLSYDENEDEVFLGRQVTQHKNISDETHRQIDKEVRKIIDNAYGNARDILGAHTIQLKLMADALMHYETIDAKQIDQIMQGKEPDPPAGWNDDDHPPRSPGPSDGAEPASDRVAAPPVEQA